MRLAQAAYILILALFTRTMLAQPGPPTHAAQPDLGKHSIQFVQVEPGVRVEVLDFGGTGRPMVFLSALGSDAHEWDKFAPNFTAKFHVYAFTRRGFGASDKPPATRDNYKADRLGDDVLAVMHALDLKRPVLVGWSVGGEELSSVGSRHPEEVEALVYLDAGYPYAFYNSAKPEPPFDRSELRQLLDDYAQDPMNLDLERKVLASIEQNESEIRADLAQRTRAANTAPSEVPKNAGAKPTPPMPPMPPQMNAIMTNGAKYTKIPVPILAIFAVPADLSFIKDPAQRTAMAKTDNEFRTAQADAFEAGLPNAHVVRIANAGHEVFATNEKDVLREMNAFLASLGRRPAEH